MAHRFTAGDHVMPKLLLATQVIAFLDMVSQGILKEGQVSLLFVVGEENSGSGMRKATESLGASWGHCHFGETYGK